MKLSEIFRLVWLNLSQNKFKVILTSIGIVVGSGTIMMVIAIGTGGREEVAEQFKNLNAGAIDISYEQGSSLDSITIAGVSDTRSTTFSMAVPSEMSQGRGSMGGLGAGAGSTGEDSAKWGFGGTEGFGGLGSFGRSGGLEGHDGVDGATNQEEVTLTVEDMEDLKVFVPGIADTTISYSTKVSVEGGTMESASGYTVAGVQSNYKDISNLSMSIGEFLTDENNEMKEKVCVLGADAAKDIFGSAYDAYDGVVYIDGRPYVVAGVLTQMGSAASGINPDTSIYIPYKTGIKYITGTSLSPTVTVIAQDVSQVAQVISNVETVLADSYPNTEFSIQDAGSKMEAASSSNATLTMLLISMAVIVFLVGGIGIMNVLFVSVKERTNEIGILKAIGCSRKDILLEFLLEAGCISMVGAVMGVLLSLGLTPIVELFSIRVKLSVLGGVLSLLFGIITGSMFGFYPAFKASRLIPVIALNQE